MLIAAILLQAAAGDIVVVGRKSCDLSIAGKAVRGRALDRYAAEWRAGRMVRIVVPASIRTRCLAKVMFRLHDRGVTSATFVDALNEIGGFGILNGGAAQSAMLYDPRIGRGTPA